MSTSKKSKSKPDTEAQVETEAEAQVETEAPQEVNWTQLLGKTIDVKFEGENLKGFVAEYDPNKKRVKLKAQRGFTRWIEQDRLEVLGTTETEEPKTIVLTGAGNS